MAFAAARGLPAVIVAVALTLSVASPAALAQPPDYTGLLIRATDLAAPRNFTAATPINNPNGQPGATTTFSDQDRTHVVVDSIQILPDPAAATRALESAKATTDGYVHGVHEPIAVGTGGTTISGPSPDGSIAELEFDGPPDDLVAPDFVADVGTKQGAAIKRGLAG